MCRLLEETMKEAYEEAYNEAYEEAYEEAYKEAYEEGRREVRKTVVPRMLEDGKYTLEDIAKVFGFSLEEVKTLQAGQEI